MAINFEPHPPTPPPAPAAKPAMPPPIPSAIRQDHSLPVGEQQTVDVNNLPKNFGNNLFQSSNPSSTPTGTEYDFLINSPQSPRRNSLNLMSNLPKNLWARVAVAFGVLIVLIILISVIGSLFKGQSTLPYFESVLQDQQELVHIASIASSGASSSSNLQNFAATARSSLSSNSSALTTYLASNGVKINPSILTLKISSTVDKELNSAASSGDFNPTFSQIAGEQLNTYLVDLKIAYSKTTGPHGRALLASFINQANLLLVSLSNGS